MELELKARCAIHFGPKGPSFLASSDNSLNSILKILSGRLEKQNPRNGSLGSVMLLDLRDLAA